MRDDAGSAAHSVRPAVGPGEFEPFLTVREVARKARLGPLYQPEVTLQQLVDVFMEQYEAAPSSRERLRLQLAKATAWLGDEPIGALDALAVARWRAGLPLTTRHGAHRALRQVLAAAVRWRWIERNVAVEVKNPLHPRTEFTPFESWDEVDALARELGPFGPLAIFCVGTGVRPEEAFGADWSDVDLRPACSPCGARSPRVA
jgi:integrase